LLFFLIYIINTAWVDKIQSELISGKGFKGYDFNTVNIFLKQGSNRNQVFFKM